MTKEYDFTFEQIQKFKAEQLRTGTRSVKYVDEDECLYRGRNIRRDDRVPTGYWGRYNFRYIRPDGDRKSLCESFSTLKEAKAFIDHLIDGK